MAELFSSGAVAGVILIFMAAELLLLVLYRRISGLDFAISELVLNLAAGGGLVLALGAALIGAGWQVIAAFLLLAMFGHAADVYCRFLRG